MRRLLLLVSAAVLVGGGCTCLDLETFHPYRCDFDAGNTQCPGDGVCGLDGTCHARGDEQPWQCRDDSHCEGNWRCGPERVCLDPAAEALVAADAGAMTPSRVPSLLPAGLPTHVSGTSEGAFLAMPTCTDFPSYEEGGYLYSELSASISTVVIDGGLYKEVRWDGPRPVLGDGGAPTAADCAPDSGVPLTQRWVDVVGVPLTAGRAIADLGPDTLVLTGNGVLCRYSLTAGLALTSLPTCQTVFSQVDPPDRMRLVSASFAAEPILIGLGDDHLQVHYPDRGVTDPVHRVRSSADGTVLRINDALAFGLYEPVMLAATSRGLYARRIDGRFIGDAGIDMAPGDWQPVHLGFDLPCEPSLFGPLVSEPIGLSLTRSEGGIEYLNVLARRPPASPEGVFDDVLFAAAAEDGDGYLGSVFGCVNVPTPSSNPGGKTAFAQPGRTCSVCPPGAATRWVWAAPEAPDLPPSIGTDSHPIKLESRCVNPDAGPDLVGVDPSGVCRPFENDEEVQGRDAPLSGARYSRPIAVDVTAADSMTVADDVGHRWRAKNFWAPEPLVLDRAPHLVVDAFGALNASRDVENHGRIHELDVPLIDHRNFVETATGFERRFELAQFRMLAVPEAQPNWALVRIVEDLGETLFGVFEMLEPGAREGFFPLRPLVRVTPSRDLGPPYRVEVAESSAGEKILILASNDTVMASDITQVVSAPVPTDPFHPLELFGSPIPDVKFTAVLFVPVTSLVTLAPPLPPAAPQFVEGYLLQAARVFNFTASNINVWRTEEVVLDDPTEPLAVFADGTRGRVGMKNGTVYSLPSRLTLADALPESAQPATQFEQHCGHLLVSGADGIYRLDVGAAAKGTWVRLPLPTTGLDYRGARVFGHGSELRLFTADGVTFRVSGFECRAPAQ